MGLQAARQSPRHFPYPAKNDARRPMGSRAMFPTPVLVDTGALLAPPRNALRVCHLRLRGQS